MKQVELYDKKYLEARRSMYVTYAMSRFMTPQQKRYYGWGAYGRRMCGVPGNPEDQGFALVFMRDCAEPSRIFDQIRKLPIVLELFGDQYWVTFFRDMCVVDVRPMNPPRDVSNEEKSPYAPAHNPAEEPQHYALKKGSRWHIWHHSQLRGACYRLEQFNKCKGCPSAFAAGKCALDNTVRWARDVGDFWCASSDIVSDKCGLLLDEDDLQSYLKRTCASVPGLQFVAPGILAGAFNPKLMCIDQVDMDCAEENLEEYRTRGQRAADGRAAIERCKKECYLYPTCRLVERPTYGAPLRCQQGNWGWSEAPGPYSEGELQRAVLRKIASWDTRTREEISTIARLGGRETDILGYDMQLVSMDSTLKNVRFMHVRSCREWVYSYEDAMRIMTASYVPRGSSYHVRASTGRIGSPVLTDTELVVYAELCNVGSIYTGGWGCYQPAVGIRQDPYTSRFIVEVRNNYNREITNHGKAIELAHTYHAISNVLREEDVTAVREEASSESKTDKLP